MAPWLVEIQDPESLMPSGILIRMRTMTAPNSNANNTPATAAARGVLSLRKCGVGGGVTMP
jgi:hypothetical protein